MLTSLFILSYNFWYSMVHSIFPFFIFRFSILYVIRTLILIYFLEYTIVYNILLEKYELFLKNKLILFKKLHTNNIVLVKKIL